MQFKSLTIKDDDDLLVFLREEILVSYREDIDAGSIFGIDGLFPDALLETFRVELFKYSEMMPPKNHGCALQDISHKENFHRIDDSPSKSRAPHIYQTFVFGDLPNLTGSLGDGAKLIFSKMLAVQNAFAQTGAKFGTVYLDKYHLRPQVIRYPRGGGFLDGHVHCYLPQRFGLILNLSKPGVDYLEGGTYFEGGSGLISGPEVGKFGRLIIFRYNLFHGVASVDPEHSLIWKGQDGKISAVLPLY